MERNRALQLVKKQLTDKRFEHTLGVMETAIQLANKFGVNPKKAEIAAIFHDYAKFRDVAEMEEIIRQENMPEQLLLFHSELWHAPVGAYLARVEAGIVDDDILQAIRYHTTGNKQMNKLDKIIFLADYIEPGRSFSEVDEVRKVALENLDAAVILALKNTIKYLLDKNQLIYPDTLETYNVLVSSKHNKEE